MFLRTSVSVLNFNKKATCLIYTVSIKDAVLWKIYRLEPTMTFLLQIPYRDSFMN